MLFNNLTFVLDLGWTLSLKEKKALRESIVEHGGRVELLVSQKTNGVVCTRGQIESNSYKVAQARKRCQAIIDPSYILRCISEKRPIDEQTLVLDGLVEGVSESVTERVEAEVARAPSALQSSVRTCLELIAGLSVFDKKDLKGMKQPLFLRQVAHRFYQEITLSEKNDQAPEEAHVPRVEAAGSLETLRQAARRNELRILEQRRRQLEELERRERREAAQREAALLQREEEKRQERERRIAARIREQQLRETLAAAAALEAEQKEQEVKPETVDLASESQFPALPVRKVKPKKVVKPPRLRNQFKSFAGQKIFVSGLRFGDIEEMLGKTLKNVAWDEARVNATKALRQERILDLLRSFGEVLEFDKHWSKGYVFATYKQADDAELALKTLSDFSKRKALCKAIRKEVVAAKEEKLVVPSHTFYVRWPKFYAKILERKKLEKNNKKKKTTADTTDSDTKTKTNTD